MVNILTGAHEDLSAPMAAHLNLDAVWSFSSSDLSAVIEKASAGNLKRTWVNDGKARDWYANDSAEWLMQATEVQNIWVPYGE